MSAAGLASCAAAPPRPLDSRCGRWRERSQQSGGPPGRSPPSGARPPAASPLSPSPGGWSAEAWLAWWSCSGRGRKTPLSRYPARGMPRDGASARFTSEGIQRVCKVTRPARSMLHVERTTCPIPPADERPFEEAQTDGMESDKTSSRDPTTCELRRACLALMLRARLSSTGMPSFRSQACITRTCHFLLRSASGTSCQSAPEGCVACALCESSKPANRRA